MVEVCPITLKQLLLATDGSEFSNGAIREGIRMAKNCESKLTALYVIEFKPELEALAPNLVEKMEITALKHLKDIKERADKEGVSCNTVVRRSETPHSVIVEESKRLRADAIVMGRRGRTGLKRLMMGSVTARVIGHSPCNVLVVPRAANILYKNILIATDGSKYSRVADSTAIDIAKRCGANLIAISVVPSESISAFDIVQTQMQKEVVAGKELEEAKENINDVKSSAKREGVSVEGVIVSGRPYEAIVETEREKDVDLIVIGSHGRTGIEKFLMGSVTERVIGDAGCAVLVVKLKRT